MVGTATKWLTQKWLLEEAEPTTEATLWKICTANHISNHISNIQSDALLSKNPIWLHPFPKHTWWAPEKMSEGATVPMVTTLGTPALNLKPDQKLWRFINYWQVSLFQNIIISNQHHLCVVWSQRNWFCLIHSNTEIGQKWLLMLHKDGCHQYTEEIQLWMISFSDFIWILNNTGDGTKP